MSTLSFKELPEKYSNQQAVARFCHGLNDAEAGLCVCMKKPSSMGGALNEIKLYQHTKNAIYGHGKDQKVSSRVTAEDLEGGMLAGKRPSGRGSYRIGSYALTRNQRHHCSTKARFC